MKIGRLHGPCITLVRYHPWPTVPKLIKTVLVQELTTDIISQYLFDEPIGTLAHPNQSFVIETLRAYSWKTSIFLQCPKLSVFDPLKLFKFLRIGTKFSDWSDKYGQAVLSRKSGKFALIQNSEYQELGRHITKQEIWAEGFFLTWAGMQKKMLCRRWMKIIANPS